MTIRKFPKNKKGGFSLIETLVALTVLLVAVVGPISLIGDSLHKIYYAKDEIVAINFAQEGIELVRRVRDTNKLNALAWDTDIPVGYYTVEPGNIGGASNTFVKPCVSCVVEQPIYIDTTPGGLYWQNNPGSYSATQFSRIVRIVQIVPGVENKVISTVKWKTGGDIGTITISENLFNWAP